MVLIQLEEEYKKIKCQTVYSGDEVVLWIYFYLEKNFCAKNNF